MSSANIDGGELFDEYYAQIKANCSSGQQVKFSKAKGLYLSSKWDLSGLVAVMTKNVKRLEKRHAKRKAGRDEIKKSLTRQFGQGISDKIFQRLELENSQELTVSQLDWIKREVQRVKRGLKDTYCPELVQFLASVNLLNRIDPAKQPLHYRNALKVVLDEFVCRGSPREINISGPLRKKLVGFRGRIETASVQDLKQDLKEAVGEIRRLAQQAVWNGSARYWKEAKARLRHEARYE